jgi:hypothetical protein
MLYWIKKFAYIIALICFFILFFNGIDFGDPFNIQILLKAFIKAFCGGILLWFVGFIIGDITLKGVLEDVPENDLDEIEGGLIQRIHDSKSETAVMDKKPGKSYVEVGSEAKGKKKKKKKEKSK